MLSNSLPSVSDSPAQATTPSVSRKPVPSSPVSDDGANFAVTIVLVVTGLLVAAAAAADWIQRIG